MFIEDLDYAAKTATAEIQRDAFAFRMVELGLTGENKALNQHTRAWCTCLAFLASHSTKHSAYPRSPPHQRALITEAITHAQEDLGREKERAGGGGRRGGRWEDRGGEGKAATLLLHAEVSFKTNQLQLLFASPGKTLNKTRQKH